MTHQQIKMSYLRLLGWILLIALVLGAMASCLKPTPKYCWECQTIHLANLYGYSTIDTVCGMDAIDARAYEISQYVSNDSIEHSVHCELIGPYR